jgi:hypothetical protein
MHQGREEMVVVSLVCRPGLTDLPPPVTEQLIRNQLHRQRGDYRAGIQSRVPLSTPGVRRGEL